MDATEPNLTTRAAGRAWARTGFDLEGLVGAAAAWLIGLLLGALWGPLFWIGALLAAGVLMASRYQSRTPPDAANLVIAPCDGVVESVRSAMPPTELRLPPGERLRVRIASSPASANTLHAPITGEIRSVILEDPNPSIVFATAPELAGLAVAHVAYGSVGEAVGVTAATGGFGPRLEITSETGDAVRAGRTVGKRRLGGWCDVYLKPEARLLVQPGQTLVGGETVLCRLSTATVREDPPEDRAAVAARMAEPAGDEPVAAVPEEKAGETLPAGTLDEDSERLFEKLKKTAREAGGEEET